MALPDETWWAEPLTVSNTRIVATATHNGRLIRFAIMVRPLDYPCPDVVAQLLTDLNEAMQVHYADAVYGRVL